MTEDAWDALWENIDWDRVTTIPFITERVHEIKAEGDKLKEKADRLDELLVIYKRHYGNVIKYAIELQDKAELWDQYAIYDNDNEPEILVKDLIIAHAKLEAVKTWYADWGHHINNRARAVLLKILGAEVHSEA